MLVAWGFSVVTYSRIVAYRGLDGKIGQDQVTTEKHWATRCANRKGNLKSTTLDYKYSRYL